MAQQTIQTLAESECQVGRSVEEKSQDRVKIGQIEVVGTNLDGILVEDGFKPAVCDSAPVLVTDRWGERRMVGGRGYDSITMLHLVCTRHRATLNYDFYDAYIEAGLQPSEVPVVVLTESSFKAIFPEGTAPPAWAGCCTRGGRIIYNGDYINSVLCGDGNFGGYRFTPNYLFREHAHELSHQNLNISVFGGDETTIDHFALRSNWG